MIGLVQFEYADQYKDRLEQHFSEKSHKTSLQKCYTCTVAVRESAVYEQNFMIKYMDCYNGLWHVNKIYICIAHACFLTKCTPYM